MGYDKGQLYDVETLCCDESHIILKIHYYEGTKISRGYKILYDDGVLEGGNGYALYLGNEPIILRSAAGFKKNCSNERLPTDQYMVLDKFLWKDQVFYLYSNLVQQT